MHLKGKTMKLLIAALAACVALPAWAQQNCAPREVVVEMLSGQYEERRHTISMEMRGGIVEMWANVATGTWTLTVTRPDGLTCLVASGSNFELVSDRLEPTGQRL